MSIEQLDRHFGVIAIEKGFISTEQLLEAFKVQIKGLLEQGEHRPIGAILAGKEFMTIAQVDEVLKSMAIPGSGGAT
jgi:hypothetical protein